MSHAHDHSTPAPADRRVVLGLTVAMTALFVATLVGLFMLWPNRSDIPSRPPLIYEGAREVSGQIIEVRDTGDVEQGRTAEVVVELEETGATTVVSVSPAIVSDDLVGANARLIELPRDTVTTEGPTHMFLDMERGSVSWVLGVLFVLSVIGVARWKGVAALVGLAAALGMVWYFTLPALLVGHNGPLVAIVSASAILFIVVYLAHGVSVKSTTALLGTFLGIALVTGLAAWAIPAAHLTPGISEEMYQISLYAPHATLRGVLLCSMVLSGVGVLNDVTITQSSSVWELRAAAPKESRYQIFSRAMRIGRDHIASTVYTIAFAYVGSSLGMLLLTSTLTQPFFELMGYSEIAEEMVSIAVASIGLVLAIPLTTALAAALVGAPKAGGQRGRRGRTPALESDATQPDVLGGTERR